MPHSLCWVLQSCRSKFPFPSCEVPIFLRNTTLYSDVVSIAFNLFHLLFNYYEHSGVSNSWTTRSSFCIPNVSLTFHQQLHFCWQIFWLLTTSFSSLSSITHPILTMSATNRITTHSKNATQHSGLLISKPTRHTKDKVAAAHQTKDDIKKTKELTKAAAIKHVAEFEKKQVNEDAVGGTLKVVMKF